MARFFPLPDCYNPDTPRISGTTDTAAFIPIATTEEINARIPAVSEDKIHASAQWCRYDAQGERILPNNVSYVITKVEDRWGIQARFGVDSPPPDDPAAVAAAATDAWTSLWSALAAGGADEVGRRVRLPFPIVDAGEVS